MRSALVMLLLGSSLLWAGSARRPPDSLILTNVDVVDTRYGQILPNMTVVIQDGIVKSVTKIGIVDGGPHVRVMNAAGKYLVAGFWDMNAKVSGDGGQAWDSKALYALYLSNGVVGIRESDGSSERMRLVSKMTTPPTTVEAQQNPGVALLRAEKDRAIEDVYDILRGCCSSSKPLGREPSMQDFDNSEPLHADIYDPQKTTELFHEVSETGGWVIPGLVAVEAPIVNVPEQDWKSIDDPFSLDKESPRVQRLLQARARFRQALQLAHEMAHAGVQLLAGTSGRGAHLLPGRSLHRELQLLVKTGCSPFEALQSATFNAAIYLAKADKYGVVEPGHVADLVLLDGNPLQDISNTQKISGVILEGHYYPRAELDRLAAGLEPNKTEAANTAAVGAKAAE
ncbi:MAG TPA: amidohydrolase family protein [Terriglobales bacterium]